MINLQHHERRRPGDSIPPEHEPSALDVAGGVDVDQVESHLASIADEMLLHGVLSMLAESEDESMSQRISIAMATIERLDGGAAGPGSRQRRRAVGTRARHRRWNGRLVAAGSAAAVTVLSLLSLTLFLRTTPSATAALTKIVEAGRSLDFRRYEFAIERQARRPDQGRTEGRERRGGRGHGGPPGDRDHRAHDGLRQWERAMRERHGFDGTPEELEAIRKTMRERMRASGLRGLHGEKRGLLDLGADGRFVCTFLASDDLPVATLGFDGAEYWLIPPGGPVRTGVSPGPIARVVDLGNEVEQLALDPLLARLRKDYDVRYTGNGGRTPGSGPIRLLAVRKPESSDHHPQSVRLVARQDDLAIVEFEAIWSERAPGGFRSIRLELLDAAAPGPEWFSRTTHHDPEREVKALPPDRRDRGGWPRDGRRRSRP